MSELQQSSCNHEEKLSALTTEDHQINANNYLPGLLICHENKKLTPNLQSQHLVKFSVAVTYNLQLIQRDNGGEKILKELLKENFLHPKKGKGLQNERANWVSNKWERNKTQLDAYCWHFGTPMIKKKTPQASKEESGVIKKMRLVKDCLSPTLTPRKPCSNVCKAMRQHHFWSYT